MKKEKNSILKSSFFLKLYGIPSICWLVLSLIAMIPNEADPEPLTWEESITTDLFLLGCWFVISFVITLIVNKIKKNKSKTIIKEVQPMTQSEEKIVVEIEKDDQHSDFIKKGMTILFIITIASLWGALYSVTLVNKVIPQHGFDFVKNMWVFWCWIPIPLLSIVLGFKYKKAGLKCQKNIVGGFIIGFLLLIYGSFCMLPTFSEDYNEINQYREIIDAKLPNSGTLEIQDLGTYFDEDKTEYTIINAYYDKEDLRILVESIENGKNWISSREIKSELKIFVPSQLRSDDDAYYSIYNRTTNQYNILPDCSGDYEVYAMKYDKSDKQLEIHKFTITYIK